MPSRDWRSVEDLLKVKTRRVCREGKPLHTFPDHALAATAGGKRRRAGQQERIDVAVDAPRLLGVAEPEWQADIRLRLVFDSRMRAIAGQRAGPRIDGGEKSTRAAGVFHSVDTET